MPLSRALCVDCYLQFHSHINNLKIQQKKRWNFYPTRVNVSIKYVLTQRKRTSMIDGFGLTGVESELKFLHKTQLADVDLWKSLCQIVSTFFSPGLVIVRESVKDDSFILLFVF